MPSFVAPRNADRPTVVFIHVPKTAGTSITDALAPALGTRAFRATERRRMIDAAEDRVLAERLIPYGHARAVDVLALGARAFADAFAFAFLRDPVEHTVSGWCALPQPRPTFEAWLEVLAKNAIERLAYSQWPFVCDEVGHSLGVRLFRYEALQRDFADICEQLEVAPVPRLGHRNPRSTTRPLLPAASVKCIRELFARDCELLERGAR